MVRNLSIAVLLIIVIVACGQDGRIEPGLKYKLMEVPLGFPDVEFPEDNAFSYERWALGKKLFFDPVLSADFSISCGSCHKPELAFSDDVAFSPGVEFRSGTRNAPSLANIAYHPYLTREGGVPSLEMQVLVPIQEHNEFDFNILLIADRLKADSHYVQLSEQAYGRLPDAFVITRALACFERSLLSGSSKFDEYFYQGRKEVFTESEKLGMELFFSSETNCSECHSGFNFTDYSFRNNGLYSEYLDEGRFRLTGDESDRALFKVPGLRNIELTGPYMHDGSFQTLEEVIDHYNLGGNNHKNRSEFIRKRHLSNSEKASLIDFLKTLTDEAFVNNNLFSE